MLKINPFFSYMRMLQLSLQLLLICDLPCVVLAIIGGIPVAHYPFFVTITVGKNYCGGTFVAPDAVVTADRCLYYQERNRYAYNSEIRVSKHVQGPGFVTQSRFSCIHVEYHEVENWNLHHNKIPLDVALIKLGECIDLENPQNAILKPCSEFDHYPEGFAIGREPIRRNTPSAWKQVEVRLVNYHQCNQYFIEDGLEINQRWQVCYGSRNAGIPAGVCYGDFGGPIISKNWLNSKATCLIGIASYNSRTCNNPLLPSVFTGAKFIAAVINQATASAPVCNFMK